MNGAQATEWDNPFAEGQSVGGTKELLAEVIRLDAEKKAAKKVLDGIEERLNQVKESVKELFADLGVSSIKAEGHNVYLSKQIWAGISPDVERDALAGALIDSGMKDYITCNSTKLSSFVREIVQEHPEFLNSNGEIIASPEEIAAVLPGSLAQMVRVSEKIDIRIRK